MCNMADQDWKILFTQSISGCPSHDWISDHHGLPKIMTMHSENSCLYFFFSETIKYYIIWWDTFDDTIHDPLESFKSLWHINSRFLYPNLTFISLSGQNFIQNENHISSLFKYQAPCKYLSAKHPALHRVIS